MIEDLRYPIGRFKFEGEITSEQRQKFIDDIADTPRKLRLSVEGLSSDQLDTPYRPEGWMIRQVVHHLPDSHLNAYTRFKLALTEDEPTIKPYFEDRWAELEDAKTAPIEISLALCEALHHRWVLLLRSLTDVDFSRTFQHPELGVVSLNMNVALYAWHGKHHIAHITTLRERMNWQ